MKRGGFAFVASSSLAMAACSAPSVQVRALPDPAAKLRQGGDELANARSMLALGNAGLALEGFLKLRITQPANPQVYAGIAECYSAMGRYDLARISYETALAYAPHDPSLLAALASALEKQGETARALAVRAELALLTSAPSSPKPQQAAAVPVATQAEAATAPLSPQLGSITVKLPPARPLASAAAKQSLQTSITPIEVAEPAKPDAADVAPAQLARTEPTPPLATRSVDAEKPSFHLQQSSRAVSVDLGGTRPVSARTAALTIPLSPIIVAEPEQSKMAAAVEATPPSKPTLPRAPLPAAVTLIQRPNVPSSSLPSASELVAELIAMEPAIKPREPEPRVEEEAIRTGPRLERISLGEVALVTTPAPLWKTQVATAAPHRAAVQWLPMRSAEARPAIQLLNAARTRGLAAWSRMALVNRGWRRIDIGDYGEVRQRSLVLYSGDHAPLARRVAAQFGCKAVKVDGKAAVVVLLGRDAATRKGSSLRA